MNRINSNQTKDLKRFATDKELKNVEKNLRREILRVEKKVESIQDGQEDVKGMLDKLQNTLDGFVGRVDDLTIENQVGTNQIRELQDQVEGHETRIKVLESSQHQ